MVYLSTFICVIIFMLWSYFFVKLYQLSSYNILNYISYVFEFRWFYNDKNRLKFTKRIIRFYFLLFLITFGLFFLINFFTVSIPIIIIDYVLIFAICPLLIILVHYIIFPIEIVIKNYYVLLAKRKINKKNVIVVGITGSFGKTSTKNILTSILEKEFKVCASPKNYNTDMGVTRTILENLDDHDILILEMGARHVGDIKKICNIVHPNYGIITSIGAQHIETFGSLDNIEKTKNELVQGITEDGIVIFNGDNESGIKLYNKFDGKKYLTCAKNSFSYPINILVGKDGSEFDMVIDNDLLHLKTKLLGFCNINNIVTAATLAHIIGIKNEDIISAVKDLSPTPHRLQLIKNEYCTIIDDSYNSNILGCQQAIEVLSKFSGKKIVVTPGIVELGKEQSELNFKLGTMIADVADYIIIMNETNKNFILSGAIAHNFKREKIYFCNSRFKQKELLKLLTTKDCVVLFENDLPDNYK